MNPFFAVAVIAIGIAGLGGCDAEKANQALASLTDTGLRSSERNRESRAKARRSAQRRGRESPEGRDHQQDSSGEPTDPPEVPVL